jgi:general stress protein 26
MMENLAMKRCIDLMNTADAAYLTTIDVNGYPETRAMLNLRNGRKYPGLKSLFSHQNDGLPIYFTTNASSPKVSRIRENPRACSYYSRPDEWRGLMVAGRLEIVGDEQIKNAIWQEAWTMYYPGGVEDPDYAVLRLLPAFIQGYHQFEQYHIDVGEGL